MRLLGLLGGMAWPSTAEAYRRINEAVHAHQGGATSAPLLVWSFDFAPIAALQTAGRWQEAGTLLADAARRLEDAGAEGLLLVTNTMHKVAEAIEAATSIPLLHLADLTAAAVRADGHDDVLLLGTRFTMEDGFYRDRLAGHGLRVRTPAAEDRAEVHRIIYDELIHGEVRPASRDALVAVVASAVAKGARGVVAGCTELELSLRPEDVPVPLYRTTAIQADAAAAFILGS